MKNRLRDYRENGVAIKDAPPTDRDVNAWLQKQCDAARAAIERTLGKYPASTLAAGLSLGVMIGWLVKRR